MIHQGGMVIKSPAGGVITNVIEYGTYWYCEHNGICDFAVDDLVLCQVFTGANVKRYWRKCTSAGTEGDVRWLRLSKSTCSTSNDDEPAIDDDIAVFGNLTNTSRQSVQVDCAVGEFAPYRADYAGINSFSLEGKVKLWSGNLAGINDPLFPDMAGFGLRASNVYLDGAFKLISGRTIEEEIGNAITVVNTKFEVLEGEISAIIDQVCEQGDLITANSSAIVQNALEIATKVSQEAFNTAEGRLTQAESTILQQAAAILAKVSQSDFNGLAGRVSTAEAALLPANIRFMLSEITTVGSGNLLNKSGDFLDNTGWSTIGLGDAVMTWQEDTQEDFRYLAMEFATSDIYGWGHILNNTDLSPIIKQGKEYTISVCVKTNRTSFSVAMRATEGGMLLYQKQFETKTHNGLRSNEYEVYSYTFTHDVEDYVPSLLAILPVYDVTRPATTVFSIKNVSVVEGNSFAQWSLSQFDGESRLKRAGIDIRIGRVDVTAETTRFLDSQGNQMAVIDDQGITSRRVISTWPNGKPYLIVAPNYNTLFGSYYDNGKQMWDHILSWDLMGNVDGSKQRHFDVNGRLISESDRFGVFSPVTLEYWWTTLSEFYYPTASSMTEEQLKAVNGVLSLDALPGTLISQFTAIEGNQYYSYNGKIALGKIADANPTTTIGVNGYLCGELLPMANIVAQDGPVVYFRNFQRYVNGLPSGDKITITFTIDTLRNL